MTDAILAISAVVGIAAGLCTVLDFVGRQRVRRTNAEGNAGCTLPQRERMTHEGPCTEAPQLVEGGELEAPTNEKDRSPLTKGSRS